MDIWPMYHKQLVHPPMQVYFVLAVQRVSIVPQCVLLAHMEMGRRALPVHLGITVLKIPWWHPHALWEVTAPVAQLLGN